MRKTLFITLIVIASIAKQSQAQIITTFAGNSTAGYSGDGGQATAAELKSEYGVSCDAFGNIYIADTYNSRIRKVTTAGIISTIAGNGTTAYSGDGGAATAASLNIPRGITTDAAGNVYIADAGNYAIRKVTTAGMISTVAGNGFSGYSGDGGQATAAGLDFPSGVAIDAAGNLYIADSYNSVMRKVTAAGIISTIAGTGTQGFSGDGAQATTAELNQPIGVCLDGAGNIYLADWNNCRVRKINSTGVISTFAGNGVFSYGGDGGQATVASIQNPEGITLDANGNMYIADTYNHRVRKISSSGIIITLAGTGTSGYSGDGAAATAAELNYPSGVCIDALGNLYIADNQNSRIRKVTSAEAAGISQISNLTSQIFVYPNPTHSIINLSISQFNNEEASSIEVYNIIGECVHRQITTSSNCQIDMADLGNGIYQLRVLQNNTPVYQTKVVKQD